MLQCHSDLDLTSGYISTMSRNQLNSPMDLPVELVQLLKHAGIEGQELTWDLQVNSNAVSVKLVWIKAGKSVEKTGETTSQAQKKEATLTFHQEKERQTYGPVEGENGSRW